MAEMSGERWIRNPKYTGRYEEPLKLTQEQIVNILGVLDDINIPCRSERIIDNFKSYYSDFLRHELSIIKLVTSQDGSALELLKKRIHEMTSAAFMNDGDDIGITAAQSISQALIQATLNSFRTIDVSGLLISGGGIKEVTDLLFMRKPKEGSPNTKMIIHFTRRFTPTDIFDMSSILVYVTMDKIYDDARSLMSYYADKTTNGSFTKEWWHVAYEVSRGVKIPSGTIVYRLQLRTDVMYAHQVTMNNVVLALESFTNEDNRLMFIPSPFQQGIIDIVDNPAEVTSRTAAIRKAYFESSIRNLMPKIPIKGVPGIQRITPLTFDMKLLFNKQTKREDGRWDITLERFNTTVNNALFSCNKELEEVFTQCGMSFEPVIDPRNKRVISYIVDTSSVVPPPIGSKISVVDETPLALLRLFHVAGVINMNYTYVISVGSNTREIIKFLWVDHERTTSNDVMEINKLLGCEAARRYLEFQLRMILESVGCGDIYPGHTSITCDVIMHQGEPQGMKLSGNYARKQDPILQTNNHQCPQTMSNVSLSMGTSSTENIATSLAVGQSPDISNRKKYKDLASILEREKRYNKTARDTKDKFFPNHLLTEKMNSDRQFFGSFIDNLMTGGSTLGQLSFDSELSPGLPSTSFVPKESNRPYIRGYGITSQSVPTTTTINEPDVGFPYKEVAEDLVPKEVLVQIDGPIPTLMSIRGYQDILSGGVRASIRNPPSYISNILSSRLKLTDPPTRLVY